MQSSSEDCDSLPETPAITLEFPTIPVQGTPARWLSHSQLVFMASYKHDDSSCDDATSSLGDSAYDFIDDRGVVTTDDEEPDAMTASTTSSDGQEFDQVSPRHLGTVTQPTSNDQPLLPSQVWGECLPLSSPPPDRCRTHYGKPEDMQEPIEFDEPSVTNRNSGRAIDVGYPLTTIDSQVVFEALYTPDKLSVTVRQCMTSHSLDLAGKSYKVLFVGDSAFKDAVIQKIATALAAFRRTSSKSSNTRVSKFNVVPISSFGDETNPEVVLVDSSGLEMSVEECNQATFLETPGGNDIFQMTLTDNCTVRSSWDGSRFVVSDGWTLPDVAVFLTSDNDDFRIKRTRRFARSFMNRHAVQSIVISETPQWKRHTDTLTLDTLTPHVCLERQDISIVRPRILRRLPIDLNTFLRIDAGQMNRNLACMYEANCRETNTQEAVQTKKKKQKHGHRITEDKDPFGRLVARCPRWFQSYYGLTKSVADLPFIWSVVGLLIISIGLARIAVNAGSSIYHRAICAPSMPTPSLSTLSLPVPTTSASVPTSLGLPPSYTSSVPAHVSPIRSLSTDTDIASFLFEPSTESPNKSEEFKVHVLGDCHIVMRPPRWFTKLRKPPSLFFRVTKKDTTLEHKVSALFDNVYALQIPREEAYGLINVDIRTEARPVLNETFEVDFGSSWLKIAAWKRATRALSESFKIEFSQFKTSLSRAYDKTKTELSTLVQKQSETLTRQNEFEQAVIGRHFKIGLKSKALVAQTKDMTRHLSSILHSGSVAAAEQAKAISKSVTEELALYTRKKTVIISYRARTVSRAVTGIDVRALLHEVRDFKLVNIRGTQKALLKSWWRFRGLPKHNVVQLRRKSDCRMRRAECAVDEL
ncbi:MAG: hypothetical protein Q9217_000337 [Psora testacea]